MCRWIAYSGTPILLSQVLFRPRHSLIDQSLHSRLGVETTNGDGFGIGWYTQDTDTPAVLRDVGPAWNNRNLREVAEHVRSGLFFGHIRASTGTAVQQSNCHPFRHGRWMWMHNGVINGFPLFRRDLALAVDPALYSDIEGSTDSELMFFLALTFGLADDPPGAVARMAGLIEETGHAHGVEHPLQMTVAVSDGACVWAFRYSSERHSRSLYFSTKVDALRALHPDASFLRDVSDETRLVVSEPLGDLPGAWNEVPEGSYGVIQPGRDALHTFRPRPAEATRPV
ncbi:class II glutamine amidotransferase [Streptomyces sp. WAC05374]|uniref:class II glutamine amidotransferase n=1 Tax=Streptomyces sp. WAC05374 TaxID=2487420 RepID=UPI000F870A55|nr:class II glutamine amidotransferase [Streptomyces sp. WAC05374]RST18049.1 class II glutamine amidotransferase [Streptomyces sp. WAC05374]TDF45195.1 class II glutamine amidotransferase [Streptomyces sp. WAC05374]TDF55817.1 class II glutamine amidotransferase [Streptomyces sp. WAC05374]TDF58955.1 class II glutamine amidotransferase [Streptomyces sp. WAC05374]